MNDCTTRTCNTCHIEKLLTEEFYYADSRYIGGLRPQCKDCCKKKRSEYKRNNKDKLNAAARRNYQRNAKRKREKARQWRVANPEKVKETSRRYKQKNAGKVKQWFQEWQLAHPVIGAIAKSTTESIMKPTKRGLKNGLEVGRKTTH